MIQGWLILELSHSSAMLIVRCGCSNGSTWETYEAIWDGSGYRATITNNLPLGFILLKVLLFLNITTLVTSLWHIASTFGGHVASKFPWNAHEKKKSNDEYGAMVFKLPKTIYHLMLVLTGHTLIKYATLNHHLKDGRIWLKQSKQEKCHFQPWFQYDFPKFWNKIISQVQQNSLLQLQVSQEINSLSLYCYSVSYGKYSNTDKIYL